MYPSTKQAHHAWWLLLQTSPSFPLTVAHDRFGAIKIASALWLSETRDCSCNWQKCVNVKDISSCKLFSSSLKKEREKQADGSELPAIINSSLSKKELWSDVWNSSNFIFFHCPKRFVLWDVWLFLDMMDFMIRDSNWNVTRTAWEQQFCLVRYIDPWSIAGNFQTYPLRASVVPIQILFVSVLQAQAISCSRFAPGEKCSSMCVERC